MSRYISKRHLNLEVEYMQWDGGSFDCALKACSFLTGQSRTEVMVEEGKLYILRKGEDGKWILHLKTMRGIVPVQKENFIVKVQPGIFICMSSRDLYNALADEIK